MRSKITRRELFNRIGREADVRFTWSACRGSGHLNPQKAGVSGCHNCLCTRLCIPWPNPDPFVLLHADISQQVRATPRHLCNSLVAQSGSLADSLLLVKFTIQLNDRNWVESCQAAFGKLIGGSRHSNQLAGMTAMLPHLGHWRPFLDRPKADIIFLKLERPQFGQSGTAGFGA